MSRRPCRLVVLLIAALGALAPQASASPSARVAARVAARPVRPVHAVRYGQMGYVLLPPDASARGALARQVGRLGRLFPTQLERATGFGDQVGAAIDAGEAVDLGALRARHPGRPIVAVQLNLARQAHGTKAEQWHPRYIASEIARRGGIAVLLPPGVALGREARGLITGGIDALVLGGGADLHPWLYGQPIAGARDPNRRRDVPELRLARAAQAAGVPIVGICRGCQMLGVASGGGLTQHLDKPAHGDGVFRRHGVTTDPGTRARRVLGAEVTDVASAHHEGIAALGPGLAVTGRSADGVPEVIEGPGVIGYQFHPEKRFNRTVSDAVFDDLMVQANGRMAARAP
jgi:putative glutamine amidotransferase